MMISGTITDQSGRTLSGQTTEAFYNSLRHARPISIGLNCALGPDLLRQYVEEMSRVAESLRHVHPNAGLPNEFGEYDLGAEDMAEQSASGPIPGFSTSWAAAAAPRRRTSRPSPRPWRASRRAVPRSRAGCRLSGLEPLNIDDP